MKTEYPLQDTSGRELRFLGSVCYCCCLYLSRSSRFMLQHGGRALLADEMGLGKTLQAIAVITCFRDFWPVLILTPSSLRLHWATMIQQWLKIPSADIVVVLPQSGGSNRSGFTILSSNTKSTIHLDGLFNIISYDVVPKLQNILMSSDF